MVEGARLEIVWAFTRLGGSNPLASAKFTMKLICLVLFVIKFGVELFEFGGLFIKFVK